MRHAVFYSWNFTRAGSSFEFKVHSYESQNRRRVLPHPTAHSSFCLACAARLMLTLMLTLAFA
jgi:hypothetical protein